MTFLIKREVRTASHKRETPATQNDLERETNPSYSRIIEGCRTTRGPGARWRGTDGGDAGNGGGGVRGGYRAALGRLGS